jgi:hypothetical protein
MGEKDKSKPVTPREGIKKPPETQRRINEEIRKSPSIRDTLKPPPDPKKQG